MQTSEATIQQAIAACGNVSLFDESVLSNFNDEVLQERPGNKILGVYRSSVKVRHKYQKKLANPVSKRTGKSLAPTTLRQYQSLYNSAKKNERTRKQTIRLLILYGYMGSNKTRSKMIAQMRDRDTLDQQAKPLLSLSEMDSKFIDNLLECGNPIFALRSAGQRGNFITIHKKVHDLLKRPAIRMSIGIKRRQRIPCLEILHGGGEGDRHPFKVRPAKLPSSGAIPLSSYLRDIRNRLESRIDNIRDVIKREQKILDRKLLEEPQHRNRWGLNRIHNQKTKMYDFHSASHELWMAVHDLDIRDPNDNFEGLSHEIGLLEKKLGIHRGHYKGY